MSFEKLNKSSLSAEQKKTVNGKDLIFGISFTSGKLKITGLTGALSVTLPYATKTPPPSVWCTENKNLEKVDFTADAGAKTLTFNITR
jgi:hypothetical protein